MLDLALPPGPVDPPSASRREQDSPHPPECARARETEIHRYLRTSPFISSVVPSCSFYSIFMYAYLVTYFSKCNFPMTHSVRRRLVSWYVWFCHNFLKGREVALPCSYRSTCFQSGTRSRYSRRSDNQSLISEPGHITAGQFQLQHDNIVMSDTMSGNCRPLLILHPL